MRILLTSVFGPFAQDDEYGSRTINPMELYHNQVTRAQNPFSLRMSHRSWGIMLIQTNMSVSKIAEALDFPSVDNIARYFRSQRHKPAGVPEKMQ